MIKMAIVGHGFVGKAVDYGFNSSKLEKHIIDPKYGNKIEDLKYKNIDIAFICVPTPMKVNGEIDSSIVEKCVSYLDANTSGLIVIKSTITPSALQKIINQKNEDRIVFNPEFLTEKNANEDFVNPIMHVFGGDRDTTKLVERIYEDYSLCKPCPVYHMSAIEASLVKYGINTFLASKVVWFNQFYDIVQQYDGNYGTVLRGIVTDKRIGPSHTTVPGYDGKRGFGGACFPKDSAAFLKMTGGSFSLLAEVIQVNNQLRKQYELDEREKLQNVSYDIEIGE
jgi:nucleotide sugar dehydrogenase